MLSSSGIPFFLGGTGVSVSYCIFGKVSLSRLTVRLCFVDTSNFPVLGEQGNSLFVNRN